MLAGREGFVFGKQPCKGPSIFEVAADNDYMHIFKYRAYRFEMAAAGPGSRGSRHAGRQTERALIGKQPGKGLHVRSGCRQSVRVHIQVQSLRVRNGCNACSFEMHAGSERPEAPSMVAGGEGSDSQAEREGLEGSKCMQVRNGCCSRGARYNHQYILKYI